MIEASDLTKSGRLNLKVPVTLHGELVQLAEQEKVSLNYLVGVLLAAGVRGLKLGRDRSQLPIDGSASPSKEVVAK
jgi:hypothetical protein